MSILDRIIAISCHLAFASLFFTHAALAEEQQPIPIYLPIDSPQLEQQATELSHLLHAAKLHQFKVQPVKSWSSFQLALRNGQRGVFLAAPHYSAWAVRKNNYIPLLRIKQPLKYVLAVRKNDSHIFELNDLENRSICSQKPLNLDYLMVNHAFKDSLHGAKIISVDSPQYEMRTDSSRCDGFAISEHRFVQLAKQLPDKFIRLHQSSILNNYSITAHPNIKQLWLDELRTLLISEQAKPALSKILSQFARRPKLITVDFEDYSNDEYSPLLPYW